MMNRDLFNLKGLNWWLVGSSVGLCLVCALGLMVVTYFVIYRAPDPAHPPEWLDLALVAGAFLGPLLSAWFIGSVAYDRRGPTYGILGGLGGSLLIFVVVMPANPSTGLMMAIVMVLGGLNGGLLSRRGEKN